MRVVAPRPSPVVPCALATASIGLLAAVPPAGAQPGADASHVTTILPAFGSVAEQALRATGVPGMAGDTQTGVLFTLDADGRAGRVLIRPLDANGLGTFERVP